MHALSSEGGHYVGKEGAGRDASGGDGGPGGPCMRRWHGAMHDLEAVKEL